MQYACGRLTDLTGETAHSASSVGNGSCVESSDIMNYAASFVLGNRVRLM